MSGNQLKDRVAIVTGGGMGIGQEIARELAARGAKVIIAEINEEAAAKTAKEITDAGGMVAWFKTDVTDKRSVTEMAKFAIAKHGKIDILVNNAGADRKGAIWELEEDHWDFLMRLNLKGTFLPTQACVKGMMERKYGRIINMSSMAGKSGEPYTSPYCTTKFGILGFTQSIAIELGPYNITANAVCPGAVETELFKSNVAQSAALNKRTYAEELQEKFLRLTPLGRMTKTLDVAKAVAFFASEEAEFITGSSLNVSGGREMH
jgi:NAD(P)-dependent dehydrogenase (short-subunit alcohol dehydrogenase family)